MIWTDLRGHQPQVDMFRRAIARGRTAHAFLFLGPSGIGKRLVARKLTQALFCQQTDDSDLEACGQCSACRQVLAGTHPDLLTVGCPEGKRELPIGLIAGEKERRGKEGLCHDLSLRPMSAGRRIAIIDDADKMNEESANALLKTLEEPPSGSILFLISPSIDALLPTIRSRCQPLLFSPLSETDLSDLIISLEWSADRTAALEIARLSDGSLDTAKQLIDPNLRQLRTVINTLLSQRDFNAVAAFDQAQQALDELGGDTGTQRHNANWLVRFAVEYFRRLLQEVNSETAPRPAFAGLYRAEEPRGATYLADALERCIAAETDLKQSMPVPLCLETLFSDLSQLSRGRVLI
ncbi:MAG: DNA polymerase III subunit delta' [Planctomycetaceae bacterium]